MIRRAHKATTEGFTTAAVRTEGQSFGRDPTTKKTDCREQSVFFIGDVYYLGG